MFDAKEIIPQNNDWITLIFLIVFGILAILKLVFNDRLYHTSILFLSKKYLTIYFNKEKTNVFNWFQILLFIVQLLLFSLLFYELARYLKPNFNLINAYLFLIILAVVSIYFGFRYLIGIFLAYIFGLKNLHIKINYEKINYFNNLILWLLPFLLLLAYSINYQLFLLKITLVLFVVLATIRYVRVLNNNKKLIFNNLLYFILYLCALELAPLIIILKLTI